MCMSALPECMHVLCVLPEGGAQSSRTGILMVVSHPMGAGNDPWCRPPASTASALNC